MTSPFGPWCGDIGADPREVELEPIEEPAGAPEPAPAVPAAPERVGVPG